jgi:hypothetical protein
MFLLPTLELILLVPVPEPTPVLVVLGCPGSFSGQSGECFTHTQQLAHFVKPFSPAVWYIFPFILAFNSPFDNHYHVN